jgi:hypothetical protein
MTETTEQIERIGGTVVREGDFAVIRLPIDKVQDLRVAIQPCPCRAAKTNAGIIMREQIVRALGRVLFKGG